MWIIKKLNYFIWFYELKSSLQEIEPLSLASAGIVAHTVIGFLDDT